MKYGKLFQLAFALSLLTNLLSIWFEIRPAEFVSKILLMPTLAGYLWTSVSPRGLRWARFLGMGLGFALIGDILLFISNSGTAPAFLLGMGAFLLMHGCFIKHYLRIRDLNGLTTLPNLPVMFLLFAVAVVLIDIITTAAPRSLFLPLIVFGMTLATSTGMSAQAFGKLSEARAYYTVCGAILVMASDALLGFGLSEKYSFSGQSLLVMVTYGGGMFLIVRGTIETMRKRKRKPGQVADPTGDFEEDFGDLQDTEGSDQPQTS